MYWTPLQCSVIMFQTKLQCTAPLLICTAVLLWCEGFSTKKKCSILNHSALCPLLICTAQQLNYSREGFSTEKNGRNSGERLMPVRPLSPEKNLHFYLSSTFAILVIIKVIMIITILVNIILRPKMFGARC